MNNFVMNLDAAIFDFDGTLIDSAHALYMAYRTCFDALNEEFMSETEFRQRFRVDWKSFLADLSQGNNLRIPELAMVSKEYARLLSGARLVPGAKESIQRLRERRLKLAIVSTSIREVIAQKVVSNGLCFDVIISGCELHCMQKAPLLQLAARKLNVSPNRCIYVGDMTDDVYAGKIVGMKTIAVTTGIHSRDRLESAGPDEVLDDAEQICEAIERLMQK